jgi:hypothetical protein
MTLSRMWISTLSMLIGVAAAQTPIARPAPRARAMVAPLPPDIDDQDRPTPMPAPAPPAPPRAFDDQDRPTPRPAPAVAPMPPLPPDFDDQMIDLKEQMAELKDKFKFDYDFKFDFDQDKFDKFDKEEMKAWSKSITDKVTKEMSLAAPKIAGDFAFKTLTPGLAFAPQKYIERGRNMSDDRLYTAGQQALDAHRYAEALEDFNQVAARGGTRADGAWYWKAYTLIKLGRRDEALAAIAELRKSYASSRWLDDAKALEVDAGKPVSPESESDEELKLIALNGLVQSDPDRAFPLLENLLKSAQSPSLKKKAVYVLAQNNSPKAQQLLEQVARGQGNPDLQLAAIRYLGERRNQPAKSQMLFEIYNGSGDLNVKHAILNAFESSRDRDHLLQIAKGEKNQDLRLYAIRLLASIQGSQADLWQLYQNEPSVEGKQQILESIPSTGNLDKLVEVAKSEKDAKLRRFAIQNLASQRASTTGDTLAGIYAAEQDQAVKRSIIDALYSQKNVKALIVVAKAEKDVQMKRHILDRLVNMKSPEATDYLMEILK